MLRFQFCLDRINRIDRILAWRTGEAGGRTPPNLLYLLPYLLKNNPVNLVNPV